VIQVYELTETFGHVVQCAWRDEWDRLPFAEQAEIKARQGVRFPMTERVEVVDVATRERIPAGGVSMGDMLIRGNTVMKGYSRDPEATEQAFAKGTFRTGDLAVVHPDGYIEVKDRLKDVIISGGENVSSIEVEDALHSHDAVAEVAVVGVPDEKWGETVKALVVLAEGKTATERELIDHCRSRLTHYKCPTSVELRDSLPRTATGKLQKFKLRAPYWEGREKQVN
jgi:fatty-acyl-CoA synthase